MEIPSSQKVLLNSSALAVDSMFILFHSLFTHSTVLTECQLCSWQCSQKNLNWLRAQTLKQWVQLLTYCETLDKSLNLPVL